MTVRWSWWLLGLAACAKGDDKPAGDAGSCDGAPTRVAVIDELRFARQDPVGVGDGFDLDGRTSSALDLEGCNKPDLVGPDGSEGIDSAFSSLVPVLEATEAAAVEGLIHDAIRSGELLLVIELAGVDDPRSDDCIAASVVRGDGAPMVGTDGHLLDHQTFVRHPEIAPGATEAAWVEDGVFEASGLDMGLQMQILDQALDFDLVGGRIRGTLHDDGSIDGVFAGGVAVAQILGELEGAAIDAALEDLIQSAFPAAADLYDPATGTCDRISMTFTYEALPAFLFE